MKRMVVFFLSLFLLSLAACGESDDKSALMPFSSSDYQGEYLENIVAELEAAGFSNIETEPLLSYSEHKDGTVGTITVNGDHLFGELDKYAADVPVIISYYELKEQEAPTEDNTTEPDDVAPLVYTADVASIQQLAEAKFAFDYDSLSVEWDDFDSAYAVSFHPKAIPASEAAWVRNAINRYILFCRFAYEIDGVERVRFNIIADGQDQYGNAVTFEGLEVLMTREYFDKFNWENLSYQNIWEPFNDNCYVFSLSPVFNSALDTSEIFYDPFLRDGKIT